MPVIIVYFVLNVVLVFAKDRMKDWGVDGNIVAVGNTLIFVVTFLSFTLAQRGLNNQNPYAFVRSIYASVMLKLFVCIIAAFIYISIYKTKLNKPALFLCMGLYLVYTFLEVAGLTRLLKQKRNA